MTDNELSERVMALSDEIRALRDRTLFDLNSAHDYYADTKNAWRFFEDVISEGRTYRSTNTATGTMTTGAELVIKSRGYVSRQLPEATFQQFIALFESFFFDLLKLWLTAYPQSLGGKKLDFKAVLEAPDKDAITELVVTREVNEVMYDRPAGWFAYLESKVNLGCPSPGEIERIAEAKASRDVLVHGRGVVGPTYLAKAGSLARFELGDLIEIPEPYHRQTWELTCQVVGDVSDAAIAKAV
jgi:hypothetical protein